MYRLISSSVNDFVYIFFFHSTYAAQAVKPNLSIVFILNSFINSRIDGVDWRIFVGSVIYMKTENLLLNQFVTNSTKLSV